MDECIWNSKNIESQLSQTECGQNKKEYSVFSMTHDMSINLDVENVILHDIAKFLMQKL